MIYSPKRRSQVGILTYRNWSHMILFFFSGWKKRLTGAVNIFSGVSKNRFRQTHHSCNDVEQLIIRRFYNCTPTTSYLSPRSSRRHQIIYRVTGLVGQFTNLLVSCHSDSKTNEKPKSSAGLFYP